MPLTNDPNDPELHEKLPNGQNKKYLVLSEEERAKGFVRPVRQRYIHRKCGTETVMSPAIAETYARYPKFYGATFCCWCGKHFPLLELENDKEVDQFVWEDGTGVGT